MDGFGVEEPDWPTRISQISQKVEAVIAEKKKGAGSFILMPMD